MNRLYKSLKTLINSKPMELVVSDEQFRDYVGYVTCTYITEGGKIYTIGIPKEDLKDKTKYEEIIVS